jgi:predicted DsbA family dithiol-disulfide isomerase
VTTRLEIVSDVVCPWCYIGLAQLERALAEAGDPFAVRWRPFQLNPDMPEAGMDHRAYYAAKFGEERAEAIRARVTEAAAAAGVRIDFARIRRAPNTLDAHRVLHWAEAAGAQHALARILFRRYFQGGEDLGDRAVLVDAAGEAGLERDAIDRLLAGDADRDAVRAAAQAAAEMGVTGVPTFILGGRYALSGAQPAEVWIRLIGEIDAAARQAGEGL